MKSKNFGEKLSKIKLLVMDIDGTLTDGKVYYSKNGEELKCFSIRDGMGIVLFQKAGMKTAFLTSESSPIVNSRAEKLKIDTVILGSRNKAEDLKELCNKQGINLNETAFIGDDINDIHVMKICGFSACPKDSVKQVKDTADYICKLKGGSGAVRELIELILKSQKKSILLTESW